MCALKLGKGKLKQFSEFSEGKIYAKQQQEYQHYSYFISVVSVGEPPQLDNIYANTNWVSQMKGQTTGRPRRSKESDKQNGAKTDDDE